MFWESMSPVEQDHIVGAFSFELGKCRHEEVKDRMLANLANVSSALVERVAANLGKPAPRGGPTGEVIVSASLSLVPVEPAPIAGRVVGLYAADGVDSVGLASVRKPLERAGAVVVVIAPHGGTIIGDEGPVPVTKSALTTQSVEYDALVVAGGDGASTLAQRPVCRAQPDRGLPSFQDHRRLGRRATSPRCRRHSSCQPRSDHRRHPGTGVHDGLGRSGRLAPALGPGSHRSTVVAPGISHMRRSLTAAFTAW